MKKLLTIGIVTLLLYSFHVTATTAFAICGWAWNQSAVTATTCGINGSSSEYYDYSAGVDDATNGYTVTIPPGVTVTVNAGGVGALTYLGVGKFSMTGGTLAVSQNYIQVNVGPKCYVYDGDSDKYSPTPNTCSTTGGVGYIRKNKLLGTGVDCGDGNAAANPGQGSWQVGAFTPLAGYSGNDWNCNGVVNLGYPTATYSCFGCTNSSGYGSTQNTVSGYSGAVPACGVAGTYYTVTNGACANPAVGGCAGYYSTSSVTQVCI
jgi:hypothetical protein